MCVCECVCLFVLELGANAFLFKYFRAGGSIVFSLSLSAFNEEEAKKSSICFV